MARSAPRVGSRAEGRASTSTASAPFRELARHEASGLECFEAVWPRHRTRHHAHPEYQLTFTLAGEGRMGYRGGLARIPVGCMALFHPNEPHVLENVARGVPWHMRVLQLPARLLERSGKPLVQPVPFRADAELREIFERIWRGTATRAPRMVEARPWAREPPEDTIAALGRVLSAMPGLEPDHSRSSKLVKRCLDHLDKVLDRAVSARELGELVGYSADQVRRLLVSATGLPPHALHLQRRIRRGKVLLMEGVAPAEVAIATGFGDQAHFTRHFTNLVGVTPARYAGAKR